MAHVLKDNASTATPVPILPTGEQQIAVSIPIDSRIKPLISFFVIKVACRIRPMTDEEILQGAATIAHKVADDNVSHSKEISAKRNENFHLDGRFTRSG